MVIKMPMVKKQPSPLPQFRRLYVLNMPKELATSLKLHAKHQGTRVNRLIIATLMKDPELRRAPPQIVLRKAKKPKDKRRVNNG